MIGLAALVLALSLSQAAVAADLAGRDRGDRVISGQLYHTNDSPDVYNFPLELRTGDDRRRVLKTRTDARGGFSLKGLKPARYVVRVDAPRGCVLRYRVDTRRRKEFRMTILVDAGCGAAGNGVIRDLKPDGF